MTPEMRMQCLQLAVEAMRGHMSEDQIVKAAVAFEKYVLSGATPTPIQKAA